MKNLRNSSIKAFSLAEVLAAIVLIAVLALVAIPTVSPFISGVKGGKLNSDLSVINSAVSAYRASGGNLKNVQSAGEVVARLKRVASSQSAATLPGAAGSFLDERIEMVMQTEAEAATDMPRVYWDSGKERFVSQRTGVPGIKEFRVNRDLAGATPVSEDRSLMVSYSKDGSWIWDYDDSPAPGRMQPTSVTTQPQGSPGVPSIPTIGAVPLWNAPVLNALYPAEFSLKGGPRPPSAFDLTVSLINPNPAGSSRIIYRADFGAWLNYSGPITVPPDTTVQAQVVTLDPSRWSSSTLAQEIYEVTPGKLDPPSISTSAPSFHPISMPIITVSIGDPNPAGFSQVEYRINRGSWMPYTGAFNLAYGDYPLGVLVESIARSTSPYYEDSDPSAAAVADEFAELEPPAISFSHNAFGSGVSSIQVTLVNPNLLGSSDIFYKIVPVPGGGGPETDFLLYSGPFSVWEFAYLNGFGIRAYAKSRGHGYQDSREVSKFATSIGGIFGGHLDLDTVDFPDAPGGNLTLSHTHDITGKHNLSGINFFSIPESGQKEIQEVVAPETRFKLLLINADLSPGFRIVLKYTENGISRTRHFKVNEYDDTPTGSLATFTLNGAAGTNRLDGLEIQMDQDVIYQAGVLPTTSGDVKSNEPGKNGEHRNGALVVQAVAVNPDGTDGFTVDAQISAGGHGSATSGALWEAALYWHWPGDSYADSDHPFVPGDFSSIQSEVK